MINQQKETWHSLHRVAILRPALGFPAFSLKYVENNFGRAGNWLDYNPQNPASISTHCWSNSIGFFCRQEIRLEKSFQIPLKFRLGSIDYTDWMEKKPNAIIKN